MFTVYAIYNHSHGKIYVGQTENLTKRIDEHNNHTLSGYTSRFQGEWKVIHTELFNTRSEAIAREKQLKSYRGRQFVRGLIPG